MVELEGVVEAGAVDGRGFAVVLRSAKDADGVSGCGLVPIGVVLNLHVNPAAPGQQGAEQHKKQDKNDSKKETAALCFARFCIGLALHAHLSTQPLTLQNHDDLVRGDGALAQDLPASGS